MNTYRQTRLFTLTWDNSKIPNLEYEQRFHPRTCDGVHFATGFVSLDNGVTYESMGQLERNLNAYGKCHVQYHDELTQSEPARDTEQPAVVSRYRVPKRRA
jgi:hypothetical protein